MRPLFAITLCLLTSCAAHTTPNRTPTPAPAATLAAATLPTRPSSASDLDQALISSVKLGEPPRRRFDLDAFKHLVETGANIDARDKAGQSALLLTVIAHAYLPDGHADKSKLFEAAQLLVRRGADASASSYVGITPLMHAVHRAHSATLSDGHAVPAIKPMLDLLLAAPRPPNLEVRSSTGQTVLTYLAKWGESDEIRRFVGLGADLRVKDDLGQTIFFEAAGLPDEGKLLRDLVALLPEDQRSTWLESPSLAGSTPLLRAVRDGRAEIVDLLVNEFHVNPNTTNLGSETPLGLALQEGREPGVSAKAREAYVRIARTLTASGAKVAPPADSKTISCLTNNVEPFGFEKLTRIVRECKTRDLDQLLSLFPVSHLSNYVVSYRSRGIQEASPSHPRVIMMGESGRSLFAFNGDPKHTGYDSLEMIEFNAKARAFEFHEAQFAANGGVAFSEKNPAKCLVCHNARHPRPNWDTWYLWPGFFRSEQAVLYPMEKAAYDEFLANREGPRYRRLLPVADSPNPLTFGRWNYNPGTKNIKMDTVVQDLNSEAIIQDIVSSPATQRYKYAVLGALSCPNPMSDFVPPSTEHWTPKDEKDLERETAQLDVQEFRDRIERHVGNLSGAPQGNYVQDFVEGTGYRSGQGYETRRTARLRYLVEGAALGLPIEEWSTIFEPVSRHYVLHELQLVEAKLWKAWLSASNPTDADLSTLYRARFSELPRDRIDFQGLFRGSDLKPEVVGVDAEPLCKRLVAASVASLHSK